MRGAFVGGQVDRTENQKGREGHAQSESRCDWLRNISGIYFQAGQTFEILDIVACADLIPERAQAAAEKYGIPKACTTEIAGGSRDWRS